MAKRGDGREGGAVQRAAQRLAERRVRHRLGRRAVVGPGPGRVVERRRGTAPTRSSTWIHGRYWSPPATGPPTPSLNGGQHLLQRAAVLVEHDAGADLHDAQPELGGRRRPRAPTRRRRRRGSRCPAGVDSGDALVAVLAVVADGAERHERPRRQRPRLAQARDEVARSRSRGSRGSGACASSLQRWATGSPARCTTASRCTQRLGRRGLRRRVPAHAPRRRASRRAFSGDARQHRDAVAALAQRLHELAPDQPGRAGERDVHGHHLRSTRRDRAAGDQLAQLLDVQRREADRVARAVRAGAARLGRRPPRPRPARRRG